MKNLKLILFAAFLIQTSSLAAEPALPDWAIGPFNRPANAQPVIKPDPASVFDCPMRKAPVHWETKHTFNPAAVMKDGKIYVLYRAEDDTGKGGIGQFTSRIGLAVSDDGIHFVKEPKPVLFPAEDDQKDHEWYGGCEDPRIAEGPDGTYYLTYTMYARDIPTKGIRLGIATSKDLHIWTKHGYAGIGRKSATIVQEIKDGRLIAAKINGKYWMYVGESSVSLASSDDLIHWGNGKKVMTTRKGFADSGLDEVGPLALLTDKGIILFYNGMNRSPDKGGDPQLSTGVYTGMQALFDANDPGKLIARMDQPYIQPELPWEKSGQYKQGTTFTEGLALFKNQWFLYYGCADTFVGVAMADYNSKLRDTPPRVGAGIPATANNTSKLATTQTPVFGPFNAAARGGGPGHVEWFDGAPPTEPEAAWTVSAWINPTAAISSPTLVAGFGDGTDYIGAERFIGADAKGWFLWCGEFTLNKNQKGKKKDPVTPVSRLETSIAAKPGAWQHVAATYNGKILRLFVDGTPAGESNVKLTRAAMQPQVAPPSPWKEGACFNGKVADFTIWDRAMDAAQMARMAKDSTGLETRSFAAAPEGPTPDNRTDAKSFANGGRNIPPQKPDTFPKPVPPVELKRTPKLAARQLPQPNAAGNIILNRGWEMAEAATVTAAPELISKPGFETPSWYDATVPGTALTTLVQQGVYPDPMHGLNNMLIPDLSTKSWWYRVEFSTPSAWKDRNVELLFKGVNYHAEVWLNGRPLGDVTGAFLRGRFDATPALAASGANVLAVRIWPQPHYTMGCGEASVKFGPGPNGSDGLLDGPTFFCTEGWDWIPTVRDRCTGIWQDVILSPSGPVTVADPQVVTKLPKLPDLSVAELTIKAEVSNLTGQPQTVSLNAEIAGVKCVKKLSLAPRESRAVTLTPAEFPGLVIKNPHLWWPNGYGKPELQELSMSIVDSTGNISDNLSQRVGLRQMDYEFMPKAEKPTPENGVLVIKVNGQRIFIRGGNWGLDDMLKRCSIERLEPAFRLEREAGLNMIRNWTGQNTEDSFYELADKYGLLVWNDFWLSTTGFNLPAIEADRFIANLEDVVKRYRNHASIAVWCGRNEGTPPTWLNERMGDKIKSLDDSRIYMPASTRGHLTGSGPWTYKDPKWYFTDHAKGFCTELGINSIPTIDALRAMLDPSQYWPWENNDAWAYHDFPSFSHGDIKPFRMEAERRYGVGKDLEGFIRRMQMANYTHHRVMFEAFNSKMWNPAAGVLLWMSHPCWPSMVWQLYTSDYDTQASFFGAKKACEPVHVQWNLDDDTVAVVNTTAAAIPQASLKVVIAGLDGSILKTVATPVNIPSSSVVRFSKIDWADFTAQPVQFVKLELHDRNGSLLSENFYWNSAKPEDLRALENLPPVALDVKVRFGSDGDETLATVEIANPSRHVALMTHLVLRNASNGERILPVYASDNYLNLLPGEKKTVMLRCARKDAADNMTLTLDGWNIHPGSAKVVPANPKP